MLKFNKKVDGRFWECRTGDISIEVQRCSHAYDKEYWIWVSDATVNINNTGDNKQFTVISADKYSKRAAINYIIKLLAKYGNPKSYDQFNKMHKS